MALSACEGCSFVRIATDLLVAAYPPWSDLAIPSGQHPPRNRGLVSGLPQHTHFFQIPPDRRPVLKILKIPKAPQDLSCLLSFHFDSRPTTSTYFRSNRARNSQRRQRDSTLFASCNSHRSRLSTLTFNFASISPTSALHLHRHHRWLVGLHQFYTLIPTVVTVLTSLVTSPPLPLHTFSSTGSLTSSSHTVAITVLYLEFCYSYII
ncbi:hypothetical protein C8R43DRAFT_1111369, partial [Mycena crocata]